jgi:hypothetical protein
MDLILLLKSRQISLREAERLFRETLKKIDRNESQPEWWETLEMSKYEAAAYMHGATFADIVKLRYEGWPNVCSRCGQPIDYKQFGWWFVHRRDGKPHLRHIVCPKTNVRGSTSPKRTKRIRKKQ